MSNIIKIPGMIDPHTHLRDLDWSHKATFESETKAAVAGGYWLIFDMPNTPPETVNRQALDQKIAALDAQAHCDWGVYAGASQADNTAEYASMAQDTCGLKIFNNSTTGNLLIEDQSMRDKHYAAWSDERIIAVHAEEDTILDILELVRTHQKHTHFLHISSAREIAYLRDAKEEGLPISIGVCPHHLYMTENDVASMGGYAMMKPPLKAKADVATLWKAIQNGIVDVIESDHAPHTRADKEADSPAYGVPGLETTLPLMLTAVQQERVSLERVIQMVSVNTQRIWNLEVPEETYTLVDLDATYTIDNTNLHTQCGWTPYDGMTVHGRILETWIRGVKVYDGERCLSPPGFGQNVFGTNT